MTVTPTDVLVAGYEEVDIATNDFERLVALVRKGSVQVEGVILITHDRDGNVSVRQTGDHRGRKGAGWGGGVGVAVGLFAPPLLIVTTPASRAARSARRRPLGLRALAPLASSPGGPTSLTSPPAGTSYGKVL